MPCTQASSEHDRIGCNYQCISCPCEVHCSHYFLLVHLKLIQYFPSATRESAFIHAITSAGLVSAVTEACAQGRSAYCSCDRTYRRSPSSAGWKWGGCSRDVNFGLRYAERFVDATENGRKRSPRKDMNKHNNEAGRKVGVMHSSSNSMSSSFQERIHLS